VTKSSRPLPLNTLVIRLTAESLLLTTCVYYRGLKPEARLWRVSTKNNIKILVVPTFPRYIEPCSNRPILAKREMKRISRACGKALNRSSYYGSFSIPNTRSFLTQSQRRATTGRWGGLSFPIIDHHYEYEFYPGAMVMVMMVNLDILQCDCGRCGRSWTPSSRWIGRVGSRYSVY
jgi:hypothetical protein